LYSFGMSSTESPAAPILSTASLPSITAEQARAIFAQGEEAVVFALLELAKQHADLAAQLAEARSPSVTPTTPSGMVPVYLKPALKKRKQPVGAQPGHPGARRERPVHIDHDEVHRATACPDCGGPLNKCAETRIRYIEDIPDTKPELTQHTIHRDWCPRCKQKVEPPITAALPGSTLGLRVLVLSAWLHYALGNTLGQLLEVFNFHLQLKITEGGLIQMWYRLQELLFEWYEQIRQEALGSAVLQADETGWRVDGKTNWLWCFTNADCTYYLIDRSRGSPALARFFTTEFSGTLVSDFWGAYNAVACADRQMCLVHLLRELEQTLHYKNPGDGWSEFEKKLRRLLGDAIRLWKSRDELEAATLASRRARLDQRLQELLDTDWQNQHARRLLKRLRRHQQDLFTFLDRAGVPFDNNHAERSIRPAVVIRKNSYGNRSEQGADCQAVLMSIFRTLKQRGHDPIRTIIAALQEALKSKKLPPLPAKITSDG
jgi:transposase